MAASAPDPQQAPQAPQTDKGKGKQLEYAKVVPVPNVHLLTVEYPGIIADAPPILHPGEYSPLDKALSTFHPSSLPPHTSSPHSGLQYLANIHRHDLKVVECRLGSFASPPHASSSTTSTTSTSTNADIHDMYRSPLIGQAVNTQNLVIRVNKRVWKKKRRKKPDDHGVIDESQPTEYTGDVRKEYTIQVVGVADKTLRFRSMADFAFKPDLTPGRAQAQAPAPAPADADAMHVDTEASSPSQSELALDPVIQLHSALARMDLQALKRWQAPEQLEDYEVLVDDGKGAKTKRSNLRMLPPAFFSRADVPFSYNMQQTPYSELRTVPRPPHMAKPLDPARTLTTSAATDTHMQRFVNRVRLTNIAPQPFRLGKDADVPTQPSVEVLRIENRCDPRVLSRLREILERRPIWSRLAFKSQLTPKEIYELEGTNAKVYFALVGYSMVGGPWRDTIVRFGYDTRTQVESRVYQRIFLRSKRDWIGAGDTDAAVPAPAAAAAAGGGGGEAGHDVATESGGAGTGHMHLRKSYPTSRRPTVPVPVPDESSTSPADLAEVRGTQLAQSHRNVHKFDGRTLNRSIGNFQLCDIEDDMIRPYIVRTNEDPDHEGLGITWLRDVCDDETGWYTRRALDLIRQLVAARFKSLMDKGTPLGHEAVQDIVRRTKAKWAEEDADDPIPAPAPAPAPARAAEMIDPRLLDDTRRTKSVPIQAWNEQVHRSLHDQEEQEETADVG